MTNRVLRSKHAFAGRGVGRRIVRVSAMRLLAAGAICAANPAAAIDITDISQLQPALNAATATSSDFNIQLVITGGDLDLGGMDFFLGSATTQGLARFTTADGVVRTVSNGDIFVTSPNDTNFTLLVLDPSIVWDAGVTLNDFARLDIDGPTALGASGTVTATGTSEIRLFTGVGVANTWDADFFGKISGVANETTFAVTGDGTGTITALPTFNAIFEFNEYNDFTFALAPSVAPTLVLGANLSGNNIVRINTAESTLDLNDFDLQIGTLEGIGSVDLGSGTLTTGGADSTTFAGVISGTGNLTKIGTGNFTLAGVNTYSGTTTVSAGTLTLAADQTGPTVVTIENGGTININADQTGAPAYTIENGGLANVSADLNDLTAFTIDTGGRVDLLNRDQTLASIAGGGEIDASFADLTVGDANDTTFSGSIVGTDGSLTKVGTGNLTLSGTNSFTGPTAINAGTITLDGDLQNNNDLTVATGATLDLNDDDETLGRILGQGNIALGSATLTVGSNNIDNVFAGTISETGGLTKIGTGTLTLSNAQTFTGATAVDAGTLIANGDLATSGVTVASGATFNLEAALTTGDLTVDDGATFFGDATIGGNLINNGNVTFLGPGAGDTLNIAGDFTQGSTGTLDVQIGSAGGLVVTGTANLGGTLNIATPLDPANFDIDATFDVVTAGSTSGSFDTVTDDFVFLDLTASNVGGNVQVTLARNAVAISSITQSANQTAIANILDAVTPTGQLDAALDRILASSETGARATLDQLAGGAAATTSTQTAANTIAQSHRLLDQVVGVNPGQSRPLGAFGPSAGPVELDDADHLTLLSFTQDTGVFEQPDATDPSELGYVPWASFYGGFGDQGEGAQGLDFTRFGLLAGLELKADESQASYGLSLGFEQTEFDLNENTGEIDIQSIFLSGYTRQPLGNGFNFTILGTLGYHNHDSQRNILIGITPTQASADFDSFSASIAGEISKAFTFERIPSDPGAHPTVTTLEPFVRLDYSISSQDGFTESGAGTAGLNVESEDFDSSRVSVGLRVEHQYMIFNQSEAVLRANALANCALSNRDSTLGASFVNTPGSNFEIIGVDQDDIFAQIGVGLSVELDDNWDLHFDIDQQISDESTGTLFAATISYTF